MERPAKKQKINDFTEEQFLPQLQPHFNQMVLPNWSECSSHFDNDTAKTIFSIYTNGELIERLELSNTTSSEQHHLFFSKEKVFNLLSIDYEPGTGFSYKLFKSKQTTFEPHSDYKNEDDTNIFYSSPVFDPQTEDLWVIENPRDQSQNSRLANLKKASAASYDLGRNLVTYSNDNELLLPKFVLLPNGGFHIFYHADEFGCFIFRDGEKRDELIFNEENEPYDSENENISDSQHFEQAEEQSVNEFDIDLNILSGDHRRYYLTAVYGYPFYRARLVLFEDGAKKAEKVVELNSEIMSGGEQPIIARFKDNLYLNSIVIKGDRSASEFQNTDVMLWNGYKEAYNRLKIMDEFNWMIHAFNQRNGSLYVVYKYVDENASESSPTFRLNPETLTLGEQEEYCEEKHSHCQKLGGNYGLSDYIREECKILSSDYYEHTRPHVEHLLGNLRKVPTFLFSKSDSDAIYTQLLNLVNLARFETDFPSDLVAEFIGDMLDQVDKHPFRAYALALQFEAELGREELFQERSGYKPIDVTEETSREDFHRKLQLSIDALTRMDEFLPQLPKNSSVTEDYQTLYDAVNAAVTKLKTMM